MSNPDTKHRGTFRAGVSGNPGGRPKTRESVTAALRSRWPADAIAEHVTWLALSGSTHEVRLRATLAILERLEPSTARVHATLEASDTRPTFDVSRLPPEQQRELLQRQRDLLAFVRQLRDGAEPIALPAATGEDGSE